jgi:hypothetical protein
VLTGPLLLLLLELQFSSGQVRIHVAFFFVLLLVLSLDLGFEFVSFSKGGQFGDDARVRADVDVVVNLSHHVLVALVEFLAQHIDPSNPLPQVLFESVLLLLLLVLQIELAQFLDLVCEKLSVHRS